MSETRITVPGAPDENWREVVEKLTEELTDDIPEKVVRATELLLSGYPVAKAAKEVGVSAPTIKSWIRKYPTVAHVLAEGRRYLQMWRMAQLEQQFVKAIEKSEDILNLSLYDDTVNQKLVATVAQHARFVIGLFAGSQIDLNVKSTAEEPLLKAKVDALDYIAQKMAEHRQSEDPIVVGYYVVDEKSTQSRPLLDGEGNPAFGQLGTLDVDSQGALCHICGQRQRLMGVHISKDHSMKIADYERTFLLEDGAIGAFDSAGLD